MVKAIGRNEAAAQLGTDRVGVDDRDAMIARQPSAEQDDVLSPDRRELAQIVMALIGRDILAAQRRHIVEQP